MLYWSIGYDEHWNRDIGFGVPAACDHPDCTNAIDRGVEHVCGGEPYGGDSGCGLYFCDDHRKKKAPIAKSGSTTNRQAAIGLAGEPTIRTNLPDKLSRDGLTVPALSILAY